MRSRSVYSEFENVSYAMGSAHGEIASDFDDSYHWKAGNRSFQAVHFSSKSDAILPKSDAISPCTVSLKMCHMQWDHGEVASDFDDSYHSKAGNRSFQAVQFSSKSDAILPKSDAISQCIQ